VDIREELARIGFITGDEGLIEELDRLGRVAVSDITIVLTGLSGTGKNLVAKFIHDQSKRRDKTFVTVDVSCLSSSLIESELFGHDKGAFTGASNTHVGAIELAKNGTLFLDEIGELSLNLQKKLLRAIETKTIKRLGGEKEIFLDFNIIVATNKDLKKMVEEKTFREDLFFRLHEASFRLPSLKDRKGDIPLLVDHFIKFYNAKFNKKIKAVSNATIDYLEKYSWPGNIRELENLVKTAVVTVNKDVLWIEDLPLYFSERKTTSWIDKMVSMAQMEKEYISYVLDKCNWNKSKAAKILEISRPKLHRMISRFSLKSQY